MRALTLADPSLVGRVAVASPFRLVNWLHAVWAGDPSWVNPGDGNAVASMRNDTGGGDPAQATGALRPTFRASVAAYNNKPTVEFGGTQYLDFDIANLGQPYSLVVVGNTAGANALAERIVGVGSNAGNGVGDSSANAWAATFGTTISGGTCDSNPHLFRGYANGASSALGIDGTTIATGNAGTNTLTRLTLGAGSNAVPAFAANVTGHLAFAGIANGDVTTQTGWAAFKAWVAAHYGLTIA